MYRVALALDDSLDRPDGVQQHVLTLGAWLSAQGHEVSYLAPSTDRTDLPGVRVLGSTRTVRANGNVLGTPQLISGREVDGVLADLRPDIVHVALPCSPLLMGRLAARAPRGVGVVGTFHIVPTGPLIDLGARALGLVQQRQLAQFDDFLAVSEPAQQFAREAFRVNSTVVANPVSITDFEHTRSPERDSSAPVNIVFLGRLVERKGPRQLVRAVAAMQRGGWAHHPFSVTIAGSGPLGEELAGEIAAAGLGEVVTMVGQVAEGAKAGLLASADVVALPSTGGESFGISVVEALAASHGLVLVGDNAGYRTVMGGLTDQLVDATDTEAFGRRLAAAINDPESRTTARTRQLAQARSFDIETVGPQVVASYDRAVVRQARRARLQATPTVD